jgi:hypothetical protein
MPDASDQHLTPEGDSLKITEEYSASNAAFPRISVDDITDRIAVSHYLNLGRAVALSDLVPAEAEHRVTLCALTLDNGFVVIGKSAPMDPRNFDADKGRRFAYEDAIRQIWPLMAFSALDAMPINIANPMSQPAGSLRNRDDDPPHSLADDLGDA